MRQGFIDLPEAQVHFLVAGQGPPLILVHGLAGCWRWWTPVLERLSQHRQIFAFDLPGFGQTRAKRWFSLGSAGAFVCQFMESLGLEQADLVGHSMGGRVCMDVAATCPSRVRRLVLVSTIGLPWRKSYPEVGLDLLRENRATRPEYLQLVREGVSRVGFPQLVWATLQVLADDCRGRLAQIQARTLVLSGARDVLTPPHFARFLAAKIPRAELNILAGAGHNPMWDRPAAFSEAVLKFLDAREPRAGGGWPGPERGRVGQLVAV